jgi:branched-chain amino acid transport system substrate-binding protein
MKRRQLQAICFGAVALLGVAACSSAASSGSPAASGSVSGSGSGSGGTINVGLLSEVTGAYASGRTMEAGVKARFALQNAEGGVDGKKLAYEQVDTTSTVPGTLSAAQTLVQNDHVLGILDGAFNLSGAVNYLKQQNVPVVGFSSASQDFGEAAFTNMFSVTGSANPGFLITTTYGNFFKSQGATRVAGVGYPDAASSNAVIATVKGAQAVGLNVAYEDISLPIGSTDVGALALNIKKSGADAIFLPILEDTAFALLAQLKEDGVKLKAAVLLTGYGQATLSSAPAVAAAQGYDFMTFQQQPEANTPATQKMDAALAKYAGVKGEPYYNDIQGWVLADLYIRGLETAGSNPTASSFISGLRKVSDYVAGGLYAKSIDFSQFGNLGAGVGPGNCVYISKLEGKTFQVIPGANPVCGTSTGQTVG